MKFYYSLFLYVILILFQVGCKTESDITVYKIKKKRSENTQNNNKKAKLNWTAPNHWIQKAPTDFRLASFDISTNNGSIIDLSITTFPGDAGGIEQNVNRWRRQINLQPQSIDIILNNTHKTSSMLGEYFIFELHNENTTQTIMAAIIPYLDDTQSVLETIFIKMNGTNNDLQELKYEFELFCKSLHWK